MKRALGLLVTLSMLAVPLASVSGQGGGSADQQSTDEVTFYGHVFGHTLGTPMPSNTETPVGEDNYGFGSFHWCASQVSASNIDLVEQESCDDAEENKLALFSTAGFVQVENRAEFLQQGDYALLHNERGQTKDIILDTSKSITASIYLTVDYHGWAAGGQPYGTNCIYAHPSGVPCLYPYWGWDVGAQPNFAVEATLYKADLGSRTNASAAPPVQEAIESGEAEIVAQGQWGPDTPINGLPGTPNAIEYNIDLGTPQVDSIPKDEDFFIVYSFESETPAGDTSAHTWRIWSGEFFPPTYTLPVKNAFSVERVVPNFAHGKLAILGVMNTPWGSYDIDSDSVDLSIEGPNGQEIQPEAIDRFGGASTAHGGHFKPINLTWIWNYQQDQIDPGEYTVTVSASNFQHSASASCSATFTVEKTETRDGRERLIPGSVDEGICGTQTASEELVEDLKQGAEDQSGGS